MKKYLSLYFELPALVDGKLPEWMKLIPAGEMFGRDGRPFNNADPYAVLSFFEQNRLDIPLDIEHATEIKGPKGEPAPAQGWFTRLEIRDGEIWGQIEFNADGEEMVGGKKYRYISPAFYHDDEGIILGISSVGLTNKPNLLLPALNNQQEQHPMKLSAAIAAALSLNAETATEADAVSAIDSLKTDKQLALNRAESPDLSKFVPTETHQLALNRATEAEAKLKELQDAETETLVDDAIAAGKIAPANKQAFLSMCRGDRAGFEAFVAGAPKVASDTSVHGKKPEGTPKLSDYELAMCRKLNLTPEQFLAAKPATTEQ